MGLNRAEVTSSLFAPVSEADFVKLHPVLGPAISRFQQRLAEVASTVTEKIILNEQEVRVNGQAFTSFDITNLSKLDTTIIPWLTKGTIRERSILSILNEQQAFYIWNLKKQEWSPATLEFRDDSLFANSIEFGFQVTGQTLQSDSHQYQQIACVGAAWHEAQVLLGAVAQHEKEDQVQKTINRNERRVTNTVPIFELLKFLSNFAYGKHPNYERSAETNLLTVVNVSDVPGNESLNLHFSLGLSTATKVREKIQMLFSAIDPEEYFKVELTFTEQNKILAELLFTLIFDIYQKNAESPDTWLDQHFSSLQSAFTKVQIKSFYKATSIDLVLKNMVLS